MTSELITYHQITYWLSLISLSMTSSISYVWQHPHPTPHPNFWTDAQLKKISEDMSLWQDVSCQQEIFLMDVMLATFFEDISNWKDFVKGFWYISWPFFRKVGKIIRHSQWVAPLYFLFGKSKKLKIPQDLIHSRPILRVIQSFTFL